MTQRKKKGPEAKPVLVDQSPQLTAMMQRIPAHHGTYALIFRCDARFEAEVGKLGTVSFITGHWVYIGSAFGSGGLRSRLGHHLKPTPRPHWHLDYVKHGLEPIEIWLTVHSAKHEHRWAEVLSRLSGATCPVKGFGASDCRCRTHLIHLRQRPDFIRFKNRVGEAIDGTLIRMPVPAAAQERSH